MGGCWARPRPLLDLPADGGTIVPFVAVQEFGCGHPVEQTVGGGAVRNLTAGQQEGERPTTRIAQGVDFGGSPTSGPSDGLDALPPFPPLAERWARTAVESIITWAGGPPAAANAWKMSSHTPLGRPADEAVVERLAGAVDRRCVRPTPARLQNMDDPADHTSVIHARLASGVARKVRLKPSKLLDRQPKLTVVHHKAPFRGFESQRFPSGKALYGSRP